MLDASGNILATSLDICNPMDLSTVCPGDPGYWGGDPWISNQGSGGQDGAAPNCNDQCTSLVNDPSSSGMAYDICVGSCNANGGTAPPGVAPCTPATCPPITIPGIPKIGAAINNVLLIVAAVVIIVAVREFKTL